MNGKRNTLGQFLRKGAEAPAEPPQRLLVDEKGTARFYRQGTKRVVAVKHFRVDEVLRPEDREEYERLLNDPSSTNTSLHAWLSQRATGPVCKGAVGAHRRAFLTHLSGITQASKMAQAFVGVVQREGASNISQAAQARYEQLFMQSLFEMKPGSTMDPRQWRDLSQVVRTIVTSRKEAERLHEESKADPAAGTAAADPIDTEEAAADAGPALVARMTKILGLDR